MQMLKTIVLVVFITVLVIIMVQNSQPVRFNFLNWHYDVSQLLMVVIVLVIGWLTGFVMGKMSNKKKDDEPPFTPRPR